MANQQRERKKLSLACRPDNENKGGVFSPQEHSGDIQLLNTLIAL